MNRAYSFLEIKAVGDEERVISGWATTPAPDRVEDVVEPLGVQFKNPMPLLWQHEHDKPIGLVEFGTPTAKGVPFTARLPKIEEEGKLRDRIEEAWQSIKAGLVRAVSIGFRSLEHEQIAGSWGIRYIRTEVFELSAVTIPANAQATITSIKSFDIGLPAAQGEKAVPVVKATSAGASAPVAKKLPVKPKPEEGSEMKTLSEQIAEFEATRVSKSAEMSAIMDKAGEDGTTLDAQQSEQFDTLESEVGAIDKHIARLKNMQKSQAAGAKPVTDSQPVIKTIDVSGMPQVRAKNTQKLEPGIAFARAAKCLAIGHLEHRDAISIAKALYDGQEGVISATQRLVTKAAVAVGTTTDATWAAPLVGEETSAFADFVSFLRPTTILGRFGTNGIPSLRNVPFRTALIGQTSGGDGYWVGEGNAKPLTKMDFSRTTIEPLKVANIAVATMELIRDSNPAADGLIRDTLAAALRERLDIDFIDPDKAAVPGISPASILNGVVAIPSSGDDADAVRADVRALFNQFIAANNAPTSGVWLMSSVTALALSMMVNPLGQSEFPGITMNGGTFQGLPVITSQYLPADSSGGIVALINAGDIYLADEGGIDLSMSTEASLQMDSEPDNPTTASTVMVSLWQRNLVGFRAERTINFARRRASAVSYLTGVSWGA
jgi:HK97 family phage major capsid protein/HK97 family phage prohead protease